MALKMATASIGLLLAAQALAQSSNKIPTETVKVYGSCGTPTSTLFPPLFSYSAMPSKVPTVSDVPFCAQQCVGDLGGCAMGDVSCICNNKAYITKVAACVSANCPNPQCQPVIDFGTNVCKSVGVTMLPQPSCASATTPVPTPSSTYIPTISQVPSCAQGCVDDLGGCAMGDVKCICSNTNYLTRVATCISQRCPFDSCQQCIEFGTSVCNNVGVYNLPQPSCAASSSPASVVPPPSGYPTPSPPASSSPASVAPPPSGYPTPSPPPASTVTTTVFLPGSTYATTVYQSGTTVVYTTSLPGSTIVQTLTLTATTDRVVPTTVIQTQPAVPTTVITTVIQGTTVYLTQTPPPLSPPPYPSDTPTPTESSYTLTFTPAITDLPPCAQTCIASIGSCASGDFTCVCRNSALLNQYAQCIQTTCPPADGAAAAQYARLVCRAAGVTSFPSLSYPSTSTDFVTSTSSPAVPQITTTTTTTTSSSISLSASFSFVSTASSSPGSSSVSLSVSSSLSSSSSVGVQPPTTTTTTTTTSPSSSVVSSSSAIIPGIPTTTSTTTTSSSGSSSLSSSVISSSSAIIPGIPTTTTTTTTTSPSSSAVPSSSSSAVLSSSTSIPIISTTTTTSSSRSSSLSSSLPPSVSTTRTSSSSSVATVSTTTPVAGSCYTAISPNVGCTANDGQTILDASGQPYVVACGRSLAGTSIGTANNQGTGAIAYTNCMNLCTTNTFTSTGTGPCYGFAFVAQTAGGTCYFKTFTTKQVPPIGSADTGGISLIRPEWLSGYPCGVATTTTTTSSSSSVAPSSTSSSVSSSSAIVPGIPTTTTTTTSASSSSSSAVIPVIPTTTTTTTTTSSSSSISVSSSVSISSSVSQIPGSCATSINQASGSFTGAAAGCAADDGKTTLDASGQPYYVSCGRSIPGGSLGSVGLQGTSYTNCMNLCTTNSFSGATPGTPCYGFTFVPTTNTGTCYFKTFTAKQVNPPGGADTGAITLIQPQWLIGYTCPSSSSSSSIFSTTSSSVAVPVPTTTTTTTTSPSSSSSTIIPGVPTTTITTTTTSPTSSSLPPSSSSSVVSSSSSVAQPPSGACATAISSPSSGAACTADNGVTIADSTGQPYYVACGRSLPGTNLATLGSQGTNYATAYANCLPLCTTNSFAGGSASTPCRAVGFVPTIGGGTCYFKTLTVKQANPPGNVDTGGVVLIRPDWLIGYPCPSGSSSISTVSSTSSSIAITTTPGPISTTLSISSSSSSIASGGNSCAGVAPQGCTTDDGKTIVDANGVTYAVRCAYTLNGNNLGSRTGVTDFRVCLSTCSTNTGINYATTGDNRLCQGFSYVQSQSQCYFKTFTAPTTPTTDSGAVVYIFPQFLNGYTCASSTTSMITSMSSTTSQVSVTRTGPATFTSMPPAFGCQNYGWLTQNNGYFGTVDLSAGTVTPNGTLQFTDGAIRMQAIGYNGLDSLIYGIDDVGAFSRFGSDLRPQVLTTGYPLYNTGDVDAYGQYFGAKTDINPIPWVQIDVVPGSPTYGNLKSSGYFAYPDPYFFGDWAVVTGTDPNLLWAVGVNRTGWPGNNLTTSNGAAALFNFNKVSGLFQQIYYFGTQLGLAGNDPTISMGGLFASAETGILYTIDNQSGNIYRFDILATPPVGRIFGTGADSTSQNDGARCVSYSVASAQTTAPGAPGYAIKTTTVTRSSTQASVAPVAPAYTSQAYRAPGYTGP